MFVIALLLLSIGSALTYVTIVRLLDAERWVSHTRELQVALSNIAAVISRAARNRVEYVQSGDSARLDEYRAAVAEIHQAIALVRNLTVDNRVQQNYCVRLQDLVDQRIALMERSIDLKRRNQFNSADEDQIRQEIVRIAAAMDSVIRRMQSEEEHLLTARQARSQSLFRRAVILIAAAFVIAVTLLGLHFYLLNHELKARQRAEESLRRLTAGLLEVQDAERRKISRELHDSLGQYLSGVKMNLEIVSKSIPPNTLLAESVTILDRSIAETRTISHLLHPPLLDEIGFGSAARWYVDGFSQRSGIHVDLSLPEKLARLPGAVELALFRVLQESLTNIHRHSGSSKAEIVVVMGATEVELRVRDNGKGMSPDILERFETNDGYSGIGLAGMRERTKELGGHMDVHSDENGTRIVAVLPIDDASSGPRQDERGATGRIS